MTKKGGSIEKQLDANIVGSDGNQELIINLGPSEMVYCIPGAMVYMDDLTIQSQTSGIFGSFRRSFSGNSVFQTTFANQTQTEQRLCVASPVPGSIIRLSVDINTRSWKIAKGSYLAGVGVNISWSTNWSRIFAFGSSESMILPTVIPADIPPGTNLSRDFWIQGGGIVTEHVIEPGQTLIVDNDNFLACEGDVKWTITSMNQGMMSFMFSGEGYGMKFHNDKDRSILVYTQTRNMDTLFKEITGRIQQMKNANNKKGGGNRKSSK